MNLPSYTRPHSIDRKIADALEVHQLRTADTWPKHRRRAQRRAKRKYDR